MRGDSTHGFIPRDAIYTMHRAQMEVTPPISVLATHVLSWFTPTLNPKILRTCVETDIAVPKAATGLQLHECVGLRLGDAQWNVPWFSTSTIID